jgi:hypothetical protein
MKPVVDRLETEMGDRLLILRVNVQDKDASDLLKKYGFEYTPTFIFLDGEGRELWKQIGDLDVARVQQSLQ